MSKKSMQKLGPVKRIVIEESYDGFQLRIQRDGVPDWWFGYNTDMEDYRVLAKALKHLGFKVIRRDGPV